MGNKITLKEDGFTPIVVSSHYKETVPQSYIDLAQSYVDKLAVQPDVKKSEWKSIDVEAKEQGIYFLKCWFNSLLPHHPDRYNGPPCLYNENWKDFIPQVEEIKKWLSLSEGVSMTLGTFDDYIVIIQLPTIDELRAKI